jgi:hypothetical protein
MISDNPFIRLERKRLYEARATLNANPGLRSELEAMDQSGNGMNGATDPFPHWPEPSQLGDELRPVQKFDAELLRRAYAL